jgi:hypothetical protein
MNSIPKNESSKTNQVVSLNGDAWLLATDPQNVGQKEGWFNTPRPEAKKAKVPWIIQDTFAGYAGIAWYWRDIVIPANPHKGGRYLLRFWDLDYIGEVWVNGKPVGSHEGAVVCFNLDITSAVQPGVKNRIAVRVLSPFGGPIEGIVRGQTPHGALRDFNLGGLCDDVELLITPSVRQEDLFVRADPKTGKVRVSMHAINAGSKAQKANLEVSIAPATSDGPVAVISVGKELKPGDNLIETELKVNQPKLWDLKTPNLYRLTSRLRILGTDSVDEFSTRFGFRDFRFENGAFRLNGKRIFWSSAHTGADTPVTISVPIDPSFVRKDLINLKECGFTGIRFISIMGKRQQIELCDEIGLLVYEESYASWMFENSPQMPERFDRALTGLVLRDRNHPSVVMWGLLNETNEGPVCDHARKALPLMRSLDDSRVIMFSSGRFDATNVLNGLEVWQPNTGFAPAVGHNPMPHSISAVTLFRPGEVSAIPGSGGEYSVVRWTAPADGEYAIDAAFRGTGHYTTTSVGVLSTGKSLYQGWINRQGQGDRHTWSQKVTLTKGQTIDFVVGGTTSGPAWYERWLQNTSLDVKITSPNGKTDDLSKDFSNKQNPNGPWCFGWMPAGANPDVARFTGYTLMKPYNDACNGSLSNPGSLVWEDILGDQHYYPREPHRELEIARLRSIAINGKPHFLSEYGIGSGVNLSQFVANLQMIGADARYQVDMQNLYSGFLADWNRFKMEDEFASPEDFMQKSVAREGAMKKLGLNALRSNPNLVGYGMTGLNDPLGCGEGFITSFRELKPGTTDAIYEGLAPVKWCTFAEPVNAYRGSKVQLEAVLSNIDFAPPGKYPARVQVIDPHNKKVLDKTITVTIPGKVGTKEPSFVIPVFNEKIVVDGPTGKYRFIITFQKGVVATGGEATFYMTDPADMPKVEQEIVQWGEDIELTSILTKSGLRVRGYQPGEAKGPKTILVSAIPLAPNNADTWRELVAQIYSGATVIFLCPDVFNREGNELGWLPLAQKGGLSFVNEFTFPQVYPKDEWCKRHPFFEGLQTGLMDHGFYREMIPDIQFYGQSTADETVAGAFRISMPGAYLANTTVSVYRLGAGRFIVNALRIRQEIGQDPTAEWLLRNMLRYAAKDNAKPVEKPKDLEELLKAIGY